MLPTISKIKINTKTKDNKMMKVKHCTKHKIYGKKRKMTFSDLACLSLIKKYKL